MTVDVVLVATVMVFVSRGSAQGYNYLDLKPVELLNLMTFVEFCSTLLCSVLRTTIVHCHINIRLDGAIYNSPEL